MLYQLLKPFAFLTIRHPDGSPRAFSWWVPLGVSVVTVSVLWCFGINSDVFGPNGVVSRVLGFVQNLPGFYIAALAVIATFANPDMDRDMPGEPPTISVIYNRVATRVNLTRRRFLATMFAYLTALCIALTLASIAALGIADPIKQLLPIYLHALSKAAFSLIYLLFFVQMVSITFWGLYYLGERIHTPD